MMAIINDIYTYKTGLLPATAAMEPCFSEEFIMIFRRPGKRHWYG